MHTEWETYEKLSKVGQGGNDKDVSYNTMYLTHKVLFQAIITDH